MQGAKICYLPVKFVQLRNVVNTSFRVYVFNLWMYVYLYTQKFVHAKMRFSLGDAV